MRQGLPVKLLSLCTSEFDIYIGSKLLSSTWGGFLRPNPAATFLRSRECTLKTSLRPQVVQACRQLLKAASASVCRNLFFSISVSNSSCTLARLPSANSQWLSSTLACTRCFRQPCSSGSRKSNAFPEALKPRQVRPTRWMYSLISSGGSNCTIQSTAGMSSPRAATSVQRSTPFLSCPNSQKVVDRFCCFCLPWMSMTGISTQLSRSEKNLTLLQEEKKTMVFFSRCFCRKVNSSWNFLSASITTNPCSKLSTVEVAFQSSTPMQMGSFSDSLASSSTFCVCVAENSTVCRSLGSALRICERSSSKPCLKRASAQSMTSESRLWQMNLEFWRWSSSLPGVQISRLTPFSSRVLSDLRFMPPISSPMVLLWKWPTFLATSQTWMASSRVGVITITPVPFFCLNQNRQSSSKQGIRQAKVFPEPVFAAPSTSLPFNRYGIVRA